MRWDEGKLSKLWIKISTLEKGKTICIPLSVSQYHHNQLKDMFGKVDISGKKIDFIIQELNREWNTIGSKAQDSEVGKLVIEAKGEIEKMREQVQNVE